MNKRASLNDQFDHQSSRQHTFFEETQFDLKMLKKNN